MDSGQGERGAHIDPATNRLRIRPKGLKPKPPQYTGPLWWWSGFAKHDGYGDICRNAALAFSKQTDLRIASFRAFHSEVRRLGLGGLLQDGETYADGPQFSIQGIGHILPPMGTKNAVFTMHEASLLDSRWIEAMNRYNLVIVPCDENAHVFREQIKPPVEVVNIGVDQSLYRPSAKTAGRTFRFGTAGNIRHVRERKGMDRVIEWFLQAFPNNSSVTLSVKLNDSDDPINDEDPRIEILRENMPHEDTAAWLRSIDCYVDASTYEGWGMWPFHAMATGRPVIGTYFGGHREYFQFGNHIPIGYRIERALSHYEPYGNWAMPIASEGIAAMRWAADNPRETRRIGLEASSSLKRFTWDRFARGVLDALAKHEIYRG